MDPIDILKREWNDQLIATLILLHTNPSKPLKQLTIASASLALTTWLSAVATEPPALDPESHGL